MRQPPDAASRGQAMVEFALVLPLFLVVLVGILDFSRMFFTFISMTNATRETARTAAIPRMSDAEVIAAFNNLMVYMAPPEEIGVNQVTFAFVTRDNLSANPSNPTTTSVTCNMPLTTVGPTACVLPSRGYSTATGSTYSGGRVTVTARYRFVFTPLIDWFASIAGFSLNTSTRAYIE